MHMELMNDNSDVKIAEILITWTPAWITWILLNYNPPFTGYAKLDKLFKLFFYAMEPMPETLYIVNRGNNNPYVIEVFSGIIISSIKKMY